MNYHSSLSGIVPFILFSSQALLPAISLSQPVAYAECHIRIAAVAELSEPLPGAEVDLLYALQIMPVSDESLLVVDIFYGNNDPRNTSYSEVIEPEATRCLQSIQLHTYSNYARVSFQHIVSDDQRCDVTHHSCYQVPNIIGSSYTTQR